MLLPRLDLPPHARTGVIVLRRLCRVYDLSLMIVRQRRRNCLIEVQCRRKFADDSEGLLRCL